VAGEIGGCDWLPHFRQPMPRPRPRRLGPPRRDFRPRMHPSSLPPGLRRTSMETMRVGAIFVPSSAQETLARLQSQALKTERCGRVGAMRTLQAVLHVVVAERCGGVHAR
jgi:hypothetical protein